MPSEILSLGGTAKYIKVTLLHFAKVPKDFFCLYFHFSIQNLSLRLWISPMLLMMCPAKPLFIVA